MSTSLLCCLIDGEWLSPLDPPPGWSDMEQVLANRSWYLTMPLRFRHSAHGEIYVSPGTVPVKIFYGK